MKNDFIPEMIIWSADDTKENIKSVVDSGVLPPGTVIKLDRLFFENNDKSFIEYVQDKGYKVFVDAKIIEIPDKSIKIAQTYLIHKPWMLNIMAGACSTGLKEAENPKHVDALKRYADDCFDAGTKSCAVTVLTSKTSELCFKEFYKDPKKQVLFYVDLMSECGFTDIVCSPLEASYIRENKSYALISINTPGVRLPDSDKHDQARVMTPKDALNGYSDRIVIGRDLTGDPNKDPRPLVDRVRDNYKRIIDSLND